LSLLALLLGLLVLCFLIWAARSIVAAFGIGDPIATLINVGIVLIALIILLDYLGYTNALRLR